MGQIKKIVGIFSLLLTFNIGIAQEYGRTYRLTINVSDLKNANGVVQFSIYNKDGTIPDFDFEKYYTQKTAKISINSSTITINHLPKGEYAVNILHDEDTNGKIKKGWILPIEGVGFSNLESINPMNRPTFKRTKFMLDKDKTIKVKIIYM